MEWTGLNELREKYLSFFESKGHLRLPSFSLVPINDKSLFLINSGMAPMKKYFTGMEIPPRNRVTTCQKCIRTPDIENVGKTSRHGTFFEMLGNFSFGDYFKNEATAWAWEFFTETLAIPKEKLFVSIYTDDDEAYEIWTKKVGVDPSHIVRLGKEDNFWEHGTGPCGPCSEIYYDYGPERGCGKQDCKVGCDCDRYVEIWNLVFSQFDSDGEGNYAPLKQKNIDTGMGLERLACLMQNVDNLFEVDTIQNIMGHISRIANVEYKKDPQKDISLRVITDHVRSTAFMLADGVIPSNEGRGYVLRRLLRRAARHGRLLGIERPFLYEVIDTVAKENETAYPELTKKLGYVKKMVKSEEESFAKTIDRGFELLNRIVESVEGEKVISGSDSFMLYDTYGFPIDLTKEIAAERGFTVDEDGFKALMEEQRVRARNARATDDAFGGGDDGSLDGLEDVKTKFLGYDALCADAKVVAILCEGERVETAIAPQQVVVVTDATTFYAESGGQVADKGMIYAQDCLLDVTDVKKSHSGNLVLHYCSIKDGSLSVGDSVKTDIDAEARQATARNHTAAHLLQAALRRVLGDHVHQAGQLVTPDRMRFDFSHFEGMTAQQLKEVEGIINGEILKGTKVERYETAIDEAKEKGAMALFDEKYGDRVRVCEIGSFSIELCGGTHVDNTAKLGLFKILSESSVASGIRRIEAVTGNGVLKHLEQEEELIRTSAARLKLGNTAELANRCEQLMAEMKEKNNEIEALNGKLASYTVDELIGSGVEKNGLLYISRRIDNIPADILRTIGEQIKDKAANAVALLASVGEKSSLLCVCGSEAVSKGAHAGKLVSEAAAVTGGKGGGRPDNAMAGVNDTSKLEEAMKLIDKMNI